MKTVANNRRQTMMAGALGVLALVACIYIYEELFADSSPAPAAPAAVVSTPAATGASQRGPAAKTVGTASISLDPTLHMDAMLVSERVEYSGSGRNIFSPNSAPAVVIQKPIAPARAQTAVAAPTAPPPVVPCPPNCQPIDLKYFGVETSANGKRQAFLLHDDSVYLASAGDVVLRRYRVIAVEAKTIEVEDMQNHNKQTLPLLVN